MKSNLWVTECNDQAALLANSLMHKIKQYITGARSYHRLIACFRNEPIFKFELLFSYCMYMFRSIFLLKDSKF